MGKRFRVAFSFSGEQRKFVAAVAEILAAKFGREKILYDKYHEAEFARRKLGFRLPDLYFDESELIVMVFCPIYDKKLWAGLEWTAIHAFMVDDHDDEVMLSRFESAKIEGLYKTAGFIELDEKTPQEFADLIIERLASNEGSERPNPTSEPTKTDEKLWMLPADPSAYFTGQVGMVAKIREEVLKHKPVGITQAAGLVGEGGIGKTELALQYCNEYQNEYERVYWFSGRDRNALQADMVRAWERTHGRNEDEAPYVTAVRMRDELLTAKGCLVVLDNVDDRESLIKEDEQASAEIKFDVALFSPLRGMRNAHVLITSRQDNWGDLATRLPVDKLSQEEGALLFLKRLTGNYEAASLSDFELSEQVAALKLGDLVDGFQLALDQAGATARQYEWSAIRYVNEFEQRFDELIKKEPEGTLRPHLAVHATVLTSMEEIRKHEPRAEELVRWCAYMPPDWIPEEVFRISEGEVAESLAGIPLEDLVLSARGQSLLHKDIKNDVYTMHRLIQRVIRLIDSENDDVATRRYDALAGAANSLYKGFSFQNKEEGSRLLNVWLHLGRTKYETVNLIRSYFIANDFGYNFFRGINYYRDIKVLVEKSRKHLEKSHPLLNDILNSYAFICTSNGFYEEALQVREEILQNLREVFDGSEEQVLLAMNQVACCYSDLGQTLKALDIQLHAYDGLVDKEHFGALEVASDLAQTYSRLKMHSKALPLRQLVYNFMVSNVGKNSAQTLMAMNNLAVTYSEVNRLADALHIFQEVTEVRSLFIGELHPDTLISRLNVALCSFKLKPSKEAINLGNKVLLDIETILGHDHPETKQVRRNVMSMRQLFYGF